MNHRKVLEPAIVLTLLLFLLAACSAPEPQPTSTPTLPAPTETPTPFAQAGHWETVGQAGSPVSFDVTADGKISNFNILVAGECDVTANKDIPIGDNHVFIIGEVDSEGEPTNNGIVGTFDTPTTVSGSIDGSWDCPLSSGGVTTLYLPSALANWTAEWQEP
jgi:hypothetical protein